MPMLQEMNDEGKLGVGGGGHSKFALNPKKKIPFKLSEKISLSHNTRLFRFALQTPEHRLGLPIGQHMFFYAKVNLCTATVILCACHKLRLHQMHETPLLEDAACITVLLHW